MDGSAREAVPSATEKPDNQDLGGTGWVGVQLSQIVLSELRPSALAKEEQSKC